MSAAARGPAIWATIPHSSEGGGGVHVDHAGRSTGPSQAPPPRARPSPKPRGCPPMRTILHSSPEELVSSRSLGNLGRQVRPVTSESDAPPPSSLGRA